jgi:hypothetical protein
MLKPAEVPICDVCWLIEEDDGNPVRIGRPKVEACYRCRQLTRSGIYVRRMVPQRDS